MRLSRKMKCACLVALVGCVVVLPVAEHAVTYRDVYTLDLAYAPPPEVRRGFNANQQTELAKLLAGIGPGVRWNLTPF